MVHPLGSDLRVEFMTGFTLQVHESNHFQGFLFYHEALMQHSRRFGDHLSQINIITTWGALFWDLMVLYQPGHMEIMLAVNVSLNQRYVQGWHLYQTERVTSYWMRLWAVITKPTRLPTQLESHRWTGLRTSRQNQMFFQGKLDRLHPWLYSGMFSDVFLTCDKNLNRAEARRWDEREKEDSA